MSNYIIQGETLTSIADAIRAKTGTTDAIAVSDMAGLISEIVVAGENVVNFYSYDGSTLLYSGKCLDGNDAVYEGDTPTRTSTAQYTYSFAGWSTEPEGYADGDALKNVMEDRNVYAAFTGTLRTYSVDFYNDLEHLYTAHAVPYGGTAVYNGATPVKTGVDDPEKYEFTGWLPEPVNIQGDTSCKAQFRYLGMEDTISDSWDDILAAIDDGTYKTKYVLGDTKTIDLGSMGSVNMQITAFDTDDLADGSGKAPITWISYELLPEKHRMNPGYVKYDDGTYQEGTGTIGGWAKCEMRTYLNDTILPLVPENVRSRILTVTKTQNERDTGGTLVSQMSNDGLWIPGYSELYGTDAKYYEMIQDDKNKRIKNVVGEDTASSWWLRDARFYYSFYSANTSGSYYGSADSSEERGVCIGFCT